LTLKAQNTKAEILDIDPMNENYNRNTLVWHYDNGIDRYLRLIEAQCQEYYVINQPLEYDLVIDPQAKQTDNFTYYNKANAYDSLDTGIQISEDNIKVITLKESNARESKIVDDEELVKAQRKAIAKGQEPEVRYPVIIDPNYTFTETANDGCLCGQGSSYSSIRTQTSANYVFASSSRPNLGQYYVSGDNYFEIDRDAFYFDTSALGTAAITAAVLKFYGSSDHSSTDFNIQVQNGQPTYPSDSLVATDYDQSYYSGNGGSISSSGYKKGTGTPNSITLNSTGRGWINKTGTTKLVLRSSRDINANNTPSGDEYVSFYAYEMGGSLIPTLVVTYTTPNPPSAPTNVSATDGTYIDKINISWSASTGATGYKIYRNTSNDYTSASQIGTTPTPIYSFNDTNSTPGISYYYWVKAYNLGGYSNYSNSDSGWREGDDISNLEVGVFWVSDYLWPNKDLPNSAANVSGFVGVLTSSGWSSVFNKGDEGQVIEADFQNSENPNTSPDGVDIFYFKGHGDTGSLILKNDVLNFNDRVTYGEVEWGDNDVEWIFLHACHTLYDDDTGGNLMLKTEGEFPQSMNGVHSICGASTVMRDYDNDGEHVAKYLTGADINHPLKSVIESWFWGIDENYTYPEDNLNCRVIAEDPSYEDEYIWGQGTGPEPDVSADDYYVSWDHLCSNNW
jgi:hypothetical protein